MNDSSQQEPQASLATFSLLHQKEKVEEPKNDAIVAGTFGGNGVLRDYSDNRKDTNPN